MSKPIFLTQEYIDSMLDEFRQSIKNAKMNDGKISFTKNFTYDDESKVHVVFAPLAYVKMLALLKHYDSEVAWHGTVQRRGADMFYITDIVVYPQTVTGSTVNTDQEKYQRWVMNLDDEFFNQMRMQGHSHVNMGTTPSGVDENHQQQILAQLKNDDYYIFMIFNKRLDHTIKIYDYANNVMYEDKDVVVSIAAEGFDVESFIAESDGVVEKKTYTPQVLGYQGDLLDYDGYGRRYPTPSPRAKPKDSASKRGRPPKSKSRIDPPFGAANATDWDREIFGDPDFES